MMNEKKAAEELDTNNQKLLQKIEGKFVYYERAIDPEMLMVLNFLAAVQTNPKITT